MNKKKKPFVIRFLPDDISVDAWDGDNLLKVAVDHGIHIDATCGGAGVCGKCTVKAEGVFEQLPARKPVKLEEGMVLACRTVVHGDVTVTVPEATRVTGTLPSRTEETEARVRLQGLNIDSVIKECGLKPMMQKHHLNVPMPDMDNNQADRQRLFAAIKPVVDLADRSLDYELLKELPKSLRERDGDITVTTVSSEDSDSERNFPSLLNVEAGDTSSEFYAVAIDIGTTSVWAELIDLRSGEVLAKAADYNAQVRYGADVINRILACKKDGGMEKVQGAVIETINKLLGQMENESGLPSEKITFVVAAGNTTMSHILLGVDPTFIQLAPHTPAARFMPPVRAASLGIDLPIHAPVFTIPSISAWVGGDIVAGTLVSGFASSDQLTLFIDLGTNGEIVLGNQDFLLAASCSAGPAFEGGDIRHGMRAMDGAIEDFHLNSAEAEPMVLTIAQAPALGICGSGLINAIAGMFLAGVLQPDGKFDTSKNISRLQEGQDGMEYVLVRGEISGTGADIVLSEVDIDNLLRAKSAVYAGIRTLFSNMGMEVDMVEQVLIAGSFGQSLDIERAITIGLLPDLPPERYRFIGNGSLMGARLAAQCSKGMAEGERIAAAMTYLDLGASNTFMDEYMAGNFLPHTNSEYFPSVNSLLEKNKTL